MLVSSTRQKYKEVVSVYANISLNIISKLFSTVAVLLIAACGGDEGGPSPSATVSSNSMEVATKSTFTTVALVDWQISNMEDLYKISVSDTAASIKNAEVSFFSGETGVIELEFYQSEALAAGTRHESIDVYFCKDDFCDSQFSGSPQTINITVEVPDLGYNVSDIGDWNYQPAEVLSRKVLEHDIVDAEYLRKQDLLLIASSWPSNKLYAYSGPGFLKTEFDLSLPPTAVSTYADDTDITIAVGHDAWISVIQYNESSPSSSAQKSVNISAKVFDLVNDNTAIYAVPEYDQWENLRRVGIADNVETSSTGNFIYAASKIQRHPDGGKVYLAARGHSPADIESIDISVNPPSYLRDSPYHGNYSMCGDLWASESGDRIYTACGNTFRSSEVDTQDMLYSGKLTSDSEIDGLFSWISDAPENNEIAAVINSNDWNCPIKDDRKCTGHIAIYSYDFFNVIERKQFRRLTIPGSTSKYLEDPRFAFFDSSGEKTYVLTELLESPSPRSYWVELDR